MNIQNTLLQGTRRHFFSQCGMGLGSVALASMMNDRLLANPLAPQKPHHAPKAKNVMTKSNPSIIPRNHRIEEMIVAATNGDYAPFQRLLAATGAPFSDAPEFNDLRRPPSAEEEIEATFCGT